MKKVKKTIKHKFETLPNKRHVITIKFKINISCCFEIARNGTHADPVLAAKRSKLMSELFFARTRVARRPIGNWLRLESEGFTLARRYLMFRPISILGLRRQRNYFRFLDNWAFVRGKG